MERKLIPRRSRMQPNRLWRLWKKPSWEAKRLVLVRKRRQQRKLRALQQQQRKLRALQQQQRKLRALPQQLPDDVLAEHIFSKLSLETLLHIRLTCKRWNQLISGRVFDSIEPRQTLVHILHRDRRRAKTIAVAHNPSTLNAVWRPIWWPRDDGGWFAQVDGPFVVQVHEYSSGDPASSRCSRVFTVHNLLTKEYHVIPEPVPALSESEKRRSDRCLTLFGATKEDYNALMVTLITSVRGEDPTTHSTSYFYTHLYASATNTWRHISCTSLTDEDLGIDHEEATGLPDVANFGHGFFNGRFVFLTCGTSFLKHARHNKHRLWAFDLQQQTWTRIPTNIYGPQRSSPCLSESLVRGIKYVTCMGKLLAVVVDGTAWWHWIQKGVTDSEHTETAIIFQFCGFPLDGVGTQGWKVISRMPPGLMLCFHGIGLAASYVVNEVIYFCPSVKFGGLRRRFAVLYDLREDSWKKLQESIKFEHCLQLQQK